MNRKIYSAFDGASPTTVAQAKFALPAALATLVQIGVPATTPIVVLEWNFSIDTPASAATVIMELLQTDVAAGAGTSLTPTKWGDPNAVASLCVGGAALTMFNDGAITEGTVAATRVFDAHLITPPFLYSKQFPLGREPEVAISTFLRIRATASVACNCICNILWEE